MGFSRQPFGQLLGGATVLLSVGGLYRLRTGVRVWEPRAWIKEKLALVEERVVAEQRAAQRWNNSAKTARPQPETDVRRTVVALNFSFDGKPADPRG
jgi:hypothetical protein